MLTVEISTKRVPRLTRVRRLTDDQGLIDASVEHMILVEAMARKHLAINHIE
jgi:hypothetical protein